jgi:hypothetical protein
MEERTGWARTLERDLAQHARLVAHLTSDLVDRLTWVTTLELERTRLEDRLQEQASQIQRIETELDSRAAWALRLQQELEEQTRQSQSRISAIPLSYF